jgi:hypothetical protein
MEAQFEGQKGASQGGPSPCLIPSSKHHVVERLLHPPITSLILSRQSSTAFPNNIVSLWWLALNDVMLKCI